jgi:hypothetical protein
MRILSALFLWIPGVKHRQQDQQDGKYPGYYEKPKKYIPY